MSAPDRNWIRWIHASVNKHFADACLAAGLACYVEGDARSQQEQSDYAEIRLNGPHLHQPSKDCWWLWIEIDILVISKDDDQDMYKVYKNAGIILEAFTPSITVFKYGTGPDDDQSVLDCLVMKPLQGQDLLVSELGQLDPSLAQREQSVAGFYQLLLLL